MSNAEVENMKLELLGKMRAVPDFPKEGILFRDMTPILGDADALRDAIELHVRAVADLENIDVVVGIESRGFMFGPSLAARRGASFVPVRKPGKLPAETISETYSLEYGEDALEIHADAIPKGARVVIVDDLLATGGTASATVSLVRRLGGEVLGCLFLIELNALRGRDKLEGLRVDAILAYH